MSLIAYRLQPLSKACEFEILSMDEKQIYRGGGSVYFYYYFKASNGVVVKSSDYPYISEDGLTVSLRGNVPAKDFRIAMNHFPSDKSRDEFIERVNEALKEWAEGGGFGETPEKTHHRSPYIHTY